jgi:hypothetical protein
MPNAILPALLHRAVPSLVAEDGSPALPLQDASRAYRAAARTWDGAVAGIRGRARQEGAWALARGVAGVVAGPRDAVLQARDRWDGAYATALADEELADATASYRVHQDLVTSYRAQAVLVMKLLEREAAHQVHALPRERRAALVGWAQRIARAGQGLHDATRGDGNCGRCVRRLSPDRRGGDCCSGMVFLAWDALDGAFRVLLGERSPVTTVFEGDETRCGLLGPRGCVLPPGVRPTVCTAYYCASYKEDLVRWGRWEEIQGWLAMLEEGRSGLGLRLGLAKGTAGSISRAEGPAAHPLDYVWGRLRRRASTRSRSGIIEENRTWAGGGGPRGEEGGGEAGGVSLGGPLKRS